MNKELLQERKKMIYDFICDELYVPMKAKEMAIVLNVPKSQRGELLEVLDALTADGKVEISGRGKYVKSEGKYLTGVFTAHPRGFGFVTVEGEEEDIFIPAAQTNGALHKDTVQITLSKNSSGKRKEGTVTKSHLFIHLDQRQKVGNNLVFAVDLRGNILHELLIKFHRNALLPVQRICQNLHGRKRRL